MAPLYDLIAGSYDATRRADSYITERIAHHLPLRDGKKYLDVACGTGNYTTALAARRGDWVGIDLSSRMVRLAHQKTPSGNWFIGRAENLPFADHTFSGAVCVLALHHFAKAKPIFREVHRVLDRGNLVVFTADPDQMRGYWLNEYFPEVMRRSIDQMPDIDEVKEDLRQAGFATIETELYEIRHDLEDMFLYGGKHSPRLYLDERFRGGISTFSNLSDLDEIQEGCAKLVLDIDTGRIAEVIERYSNRTGDYVFVIASKAK